MGGLFGGIGDMLSSFFHPERGYEDAEKEFRKAWEASQAREQPFVTHGEEQYGPLNAARAALMDPESLLAKWMSGYEMSPYAKQSIAESNAAGLDAASSQGLLGSSAATQNIQQAAGNIAQKDRESYLDRLLKQYGMGVELGNSLYGTGANMASAMGREGLEYGRDIGGARGNAANAPGQLLGQLLKMYMDYQGNVASGMGKAGASAATGGASGVATPMAV